MEKERIKEIERVAMSILNKTDLSETWKENAIKDINHEITYQKMREYVVNGENRNGQLFYVCSPRYTSKSKYTKEKGAMVELRTTSYDIFVDENEILPVQVEDVSLLYQNGELTVKEERAYTLELNKIQTSCH